MIYISFPQRSTLLFQSKDSKILILTVRFVFGPEEVLLLGVFVNGVVNGFFGHVGL